VATVLFPANDDDFGLRPLLEDWAADLCSDPKLHHALVEATITAASSDPDLLEGVPVEVALFFVMRELVRSDPCGTKPEDRSLFPVDGVPPNTPAHLHAG